MEHLKSWGQSPKAQDSWLTLTGSWTLGDVQPGVLSPPDHLCCCSLHLDGLPKFVPPLLGTHRTAYCSWNPLEDSNRVRSSHIPFCESCTLSAGSTNSQPGEETAVSQSGMRPPWLCKGGEEGAAGNRPATSYHFKNSSRAVRGARQITNGQGCSKSNNIHFPDSSSPSVQPWGWRLGGPEINICVPGINYDFFSFQHLDIWFCLGAWWIHGEGRIKKAGLVVNI